MERDLNTQPKDKSVSPGMVLTLMLMSMTAGALCLNKVGPIMSPIMSSLALTSEAQAGMLISVFVFSGVILALPVGMIITRFGMFVTGLIALLATLLGSVLGALAGGYALMLFGRLIEGVGLVFLGTIGPVAVGSTFSDKNRGSAMGLLMCYMAFGQIIMFNLAPRIAARGDWRTIWWLTAAFTLAVLVLWLVFARSLPGAQPANASQSSGEKNALGAVLRNKNVWMVGIALTLFLIPQQGVIGFLTRYLSDVRGIEATMAGSLVSVASIVGIPVGMIVGALADKIGSRKIPLCVLLVACAVVYAIMPNYPTSSYIIMIILYGIATMGIVGLTFSTVPDVIEKPEHGNVAVAVVNMMLWAGIFISSVLFGLLVDKMGWNAAFYCMIPITIGAALLSFANQKIR